MDIMTVVDYYPKCLPVVSQGKESIMNDYAALIAPEARINKVRETVGQTIQEILSKEAQFDRYEILGSIEVLVGSKIYKGLPTSLSERMVFGFCWLAREVQNGGFDQFFFNSAGDFWKEILDGLSAVGDQQGLALFRRTLSIFPDSSPSQDRFTRQEELEKLEQRDERRVSEHFSSMTDHYFRAPFPKWDLVFDYIKGHPAEFDLQTA